MIQNMEVYQDSNPYFLTIPINPQGIKDVEFMRGKLQILWSMFYHLMNSIDYGMLRGILYYIDFGISSTIHFIPA